jgi:hypothetical protein
MSASNWVHLDDCTIKHITDKAMLVECDLFDEALWIPLSQVDEPDKFEVGDEGITVSVSEWWAKKNNIEVD